MTATGILLQPFELGTLKLSNRIVMAPMTRNKSAGNIPGPAPQDHRQAGDHCGR